MKKPSLKNDLPLYFAACGLSASERSVLRGDFCATFEEELTSRCEFSIEQGSAVLGMMAWGCGRAFEEKIDAFVSKVFTAEDSDFYRRVQQYFPGVGVLVKSDFAALERPNISVYWRYPLPVKVARRFFRALGLPVNALAAMIPGECLGQRRFFTALDLSHGAPIRLGVIFTAPLPLPRRMIEDVLSCFTSLGARGLTEHGILQGASRGLAYFSMGLEEGALIPSIKIDYQNAPMGVVQEVERALGRRIDERLIQMMAALSIENPHYYGLRHFEDRPPRGKLYFIRSYASSFENAAAALRETRWISTAS